MDTNRLTFRNLNLRDFSGVESCIKMAKLSLKT